MKAGRTLLLAKTRIVSVAQVLSVFVVKGVLETK